MKTLNELLFSVKKSYSTLLKYTDVEEGFDTTYEALNPAYRIVSALADNHQVEDELMPPFEHATQILKLASKKSHDEREKHKVWDKRVVLSKKFSK
jgi:hypothetical protein